MSKKVDLFCVGSAKAGTTSLHRLLEKNGIISQTKYKEPHFFTNSKIIEKVLCDNIEEYEKNFLESSKIWADFSTSYLYCENAAQGIFEYNPKAKILIILRDPIDKALSLYNHQIRSMKEDLSFIDALEVEGNRINSGYPFGYHYARGGLYSGQVQKYVEQFPIENILVLSFDDLTCKIDKVLEKLSLFLGQEINYTELPRENKTGTPRSKLLQRLIEKDFPLKPLAKRVMGGKLKRYIRKVNTGNKIKATKEELDFLKEFYKTEPCYKTFLSEGSCNE